MYSNKAVIISIKEMSKKTNKINSYPFESADAVVGRIESFMAARYIYDDGKVPKMTSW